ncbi:hypothetical protein HYPSUDRAFT_467215 [Hypholoma sublateritium FD-334 SS-4]|uniref:Uncharacterized protein n=1 Tax=Hypholoma sublateritium (strain FD-334 SS-4) TaxID=945553 RepID=A0A0D2NBT7_HYPSF|nr:hypothetical protein HYPSUDRAFT_467215 [Hypholoma sublateritium FD-334 SS-4]
MPYARWNAYQRVQYLHPNSTTPEGRLQLKSIISRAASYPVEVHVRTRRAWPSHTRMSIVRHGASTPDPSVTRRAATAIAYEQHAYTGKKATNRVWGQRMYTRQETKTRPAATTHVIYITSPAQCARQRGWRGDISIASWARNWLTAPLVRGWICTSDSADSLALWAERTAGFRAARSPADRSGIWGESALGCTSSAYRAP